MSTPYEKVFWTVMAEKEHGPFWLNHLMGSDETEVVERLKAYLGYGDKNGSTKLLGDLTFQQKLDHLGFRMVQVQVSEIVSNNLQSKTGT